MKGIYLITILIGIFNASAGIPNDYCEDPAYRKLYKELNKPLTSQSVLVDLYQLAHAKLMYHMLDEGDPKKQEMLHKIGDISNSISKIDHTELTNIIVAMYDFEYASQAEAQADIVMQGYRENLFSQASHNIQAPNNTVLSKLKENQEVECAGADYSSPCLTKRETATIWLVENFKLFGVEQIPIMSEREVIAKIIGDKIRNFLNEFALCEVLPRLASCGPKLQDNGTLSEDGIYTSHFVLKKIGVQILDTASNFVGYGEIQTYGLDFESLAGLRKNNPLKNLKANRADLIERNNNADRLKLADKKKVQGLGEFFAKVGVQGPFFRCIPEPVLRAPDFAFRSAEKLVCCDQRPDWRDQTYVVVNLQTGISCRGFIGVPYVLEAGVKVGVDV